MRPKPTREWVMAELERLGVRVVSGRLGRKAGEEDEPEEKKSSGKASCSFSYCILESQQNHTHCPPSILDSSYATSNDI